MRKLAPFGRDVLHQSVRIDIGQVRVVPAVRGALGVLLPLAIGVAVGQTAIGLGIAIGALNVAFCDQPGAYRPRAWRMLLASFLGASSVLVGALTGAIDPLAVLLTAAWGLGAGLLAAFGTATMQVGLTCLALLIVFSGHPMSFGDAVGESVLVLLGGLLATLLAILAWPIEPLGPERSALARLFAQLSRTAGRRPENMTQPPLTAEMNDVSAMLASADSGNADAEYLRALLNQGERIRLELLVLQDETDPLVDEILDRTASALANMAGSIRRRASPVDHHDVDRVEAVASNLVVPETSAALLTHVEALAGQLRAVLAILEEGSVDAVEADEHQGGQSRSVVGALQDAVSLLAANLTLRSSVFRHAVRLAVCLAAADLIARGLHLAWPYWVPLTVSVVLRPEFGTTFSRGIARVVGTLLGLALASLLVIVAPGGIAATVVLIGVLVFATRALSPANLGLGAVMLSAMVVLLLTVGGDPPQATIVARGMDTAIGAILALAAYASWPTWERERAPEQLAELLQAYRVYARAVFDGYLPPPQPSALAQLDSARQRARLARTNALASVSRLRAEPRTPAPVLERSDALLASSHRFVRALMALEAGLYHGSITPATAAAPLRRLSDDVDLTLGALIAHVCDGSQTIDVPDLRDDERRLARCLTADGQASAVLRLQADRIANTLGTMVRSVSYTA